MWMAVGLVFLMFKKETDSGLGAFANLLYVRADCANFYERKASFKF